MAFYRTLKMLQVEYTLNDEDKDVLQMMRDDAKKKTCWDVDSGCCLSTLKDTSSGSNPRKGLRALIINDILKMQTKCRATNVGWVPVDKAKIPHSWFVCFVHNVLPNVQNPNWKTFQCSHRCTNSVCVNPLHLCWENASTNQSRGNPYCKRRCVHTTCTANNVCECQGFHVPSCI